MAKNRKKAKKGLFVRRWVLVTLSVLVVLGGGLSIAATKGPFWDPAQRGEWVVWLVSERLGLDAAQQEKLRSVKDELMAIRDEVHQERTRGFNQLIEQVRQPQADRAQVLAMVEERKAMLEQFVPRVTDRLIEFHGVLNETQRELLATKLEELRDHGPRHHFGSRGPHGSKWGGG